jgi:RHS repeat-associated protein
VRRTAAASTFEWDAENRLLAINQGTLRSEFSYDGESRRVRIVEKSGSTVTSDRRFLWCNGAICEERSSSGGTAVKRYFADGVQQLGQAFFYGRDHLGSVRELGDGAGTIKARYDYDPFGKRSAITEDQVADFGFTGHYEHSVSETILAMFRVYDARLARWISEDPLGVQAVPSLYSYVLNKPTTHTDPLGLQGKILPWRPNPNPLPKPPGSPPGDICPFEPGRPPVMSPPVIARAGAVVFLAIANVLIWNCVIIEGYCAAQTQASYCDCMAAANPSGYCDVRSLCPPRPKQKCKKCP